MKTYPIFDKEKITDIEEYLQSKNERDCLLFKTALYTGLRVKDLVELRVRDVIDEKGKVKEYLYIEEEKTKKSRNIFIHRKLKKMLKEYIKGKPSYEPLFKSRNGQYKPLSRQQAYNIIRSAGDIFGIKIAPHSLRKTFARALYDKNEQDITIPMDALNHTTPSQTRRYIAVDDQRTNNAIAGLDF